MLSGQRAPAISLREGDLLALDDIRRYTLASAEVTRFVAETTGRTGRRVKAKPCIFLVRSMSNPPTDDLAVRNDARRLGVIPSARLASSLALTTKVS